MTELWVAVVMGIVEGLTEFLPVSSTGHLIIAGDLLDFTGNKASCFDVFIQLGAILAVLVLYWKRFANLIPTKSAISAGGFSGIRGLCLLGLTTLPALALGYLAHHTIKAYLFRPGTVALALAVGGVGILLAERFKPHARAMELDQMNYRQQMDYLSL